MSGKLRACQILTKVRAPNFQTGDRSRAFHFIWNNGNIRLLFGVKNCAKTANHSSHCERTKFDYQSVLQSYCKYSRHQEDVIIKRPYSSFKIQSNTTVNEQGIETHEIDYLQYDEDQYNKIIQMQQDPVVLMKPSHAEKNVQNVKSKSKNKKKVKYPLKGMGLDQPIYTEKFEICKNFLEELKIPTDELPFYPDIQEMDREDIVASIEKLKECQIHVVFSLFLIQRIFLEISLGKTITRESKADLKQWFKLRNGMYRLTEIRMVKCYFELCQLLEEPSLDPIAFMNQLADLGVYDHMYTILIKTKKLRSLGARPKDIIDNMQLYGTSTELLELKFKLFHNYIGKVQGTFPVKLFLSSTAAEFKDRLFLGKELTLVSRLLNVKETDFLRCWSFKSLHTKSLVYKIQMCLKAGIPRTELFNNVALLDRISVDDCHLVTKSLCESGQPGSLFVFKDLESNIRHRSNGRQLEEPDWTSDCDSNDGSDTPSEPSPPTTPAPTKSPNVNRTVQSSKKWRIAVFKLICHLLDLDRVRRQAMFRADINIDLSQLMDVTNNFDFLLSQGYTKEDLAHMPVVLAHPRDNVVRVSRRLACLIQESCPLPHHPASPSPSLSGISPPFADGETAESSEYQMDATDTSVSSNGMEQQLLSDPISRLNVLQYFLEKENNFSLAYTQKVIDFIN